MLMTMASVFAAAHLSGALYGGLGTLLASVVAFLTWRLKTKDQTQSAASTLVHDALKLHAATSVALQKAQEELQSLRDDISEIRVEFDEIRSELAHWRTIAEEARASYRKANNDTDPFWWRPYKAVLGA